MNWEDTSYYMKNLYFWFSTTLLKVTLAPAPDLKLLILKKYPLTRTWQSVVRHFIQPLNSPCPYSRCQRYRRFFIFFHKLWFGQYCPELKSGIFENTRTILRMSRVTEAVNLTGQSSYCPDFNSFFFCSGIS